MFITFDSQTLPDLSRARMIAIANKLQMLSKKKALLRRLKEKKNKNSETL
jgi:hypothetical protein